MADEVGKPSISFGFSKKKEVKLIKKAAISGDEDVKDKEDTDYITSLDDKQVKSIRPKEEQKDLVIPLIETNRWVKPLRPGNLDNDDASEVQKKKSTPIIAVGKDAEEFEAVSELLKDAAREQERWETTGQSDSSVVVPLLMQNKVPEGFETDDKLDVSLRPDEASEADYDQVPIEHYGVAMLRGMGWKEGQGIGKNNQRFKPLEAVARPKGLGLGADRSAALQLQNKSSSNGPGKRDDDQLVARNGTHCVVQSGKHQNLYGVIEGVDEDSARLVIKLALSGQSITICQYSVQLVDKKDYDKNAKCINKSRVDKYREEEEEKKRHSPHEVESEGNGHRDDDNRRHRDRHSTSKHKHRHRDKYGGTESHRDSDESQNIDRRERKRHRDHEGDSDGRDREEEDRYPRDENKDRKRKNDGKSKSKHKSSKMDPDGSTSSSRSWLRPHLRVRVVDPHYKKGKYFKTKVVIEDVVAQDSCMCRTDDGHVIEGVSQSMLETVIPKSDPSYVMIIRGKHCTQVAEILKRDKSKCEATVQLLRERDQLIEIDYDNICEYTGDINQHDDY